MYQPHRNLKGQVTQGANCELHRNTGAEYSYVTCVSQGKPAYGAIRVHVTFFRCYLSCFWVPSKQSWNILIRIGACARSRALSKLIPFFSASRLLFLLIRFELLSQCQLLIPMSELEATPLISSNYAFVTAPSCKRGAIVQAWSNYGCRGPSERCSRQLTPVLRLLVFDVWI